jgi:UDP-N-acetyl-D-glucosamine dehydrogenase
MFCRKIGIDVNKVISAASTKPYGFMAFFPSLGIGGHCIPVDPVYLSHKAKEIGSNLGLIDLSLKINLNLPNYFVKQAEDKLGTLSNKKIIVLGLAYKSNISDYRETPVESLIHGLREKNAHVFWHDELVKVWKNEKSTPLSSDFDLAIIATPHDYFDLTKLGSVEVINTRESI